MSETDYRALEHEMDIAMRYSPIVEAALDAKAGHLKPMEVFLIAGAILDDPEFSKRVDGLRESWLTLQCAEYGQNFLITEGRFDREAAQNFPLRVAEAMTKEEKVALRGRLQKRGALPK